MHLSNNDYFTNLSSGLLSLFETPNDADVTLIVKGGMMKAHKIVLSIFSPIFKELFTLNPCSQPMCFMMDVSYATMSDILKYLYTGQVELHEDRVPQFLKTALELQLKGISNSHCIQVQDCADKTVMMSGMAEEALLNGEMFNEQDYTISDMKEEQDDILLDIGENEVTFSGKKVLSPTRSLSTESSLLVVDESVSKGEPVLVKFVSKDKSVIVNDCRYVNKNPMFKIHHCMKARAEKCKAMIWLGEEGEVVFFNQHASQKCFLKRRSLFHTIVNETRECHIITLEKFEELYGTIRRNKKSNCTFNSISRTLEKKPFNAIISEDTTLGGSAVQLLGLLLTFLSI